MAFTRANFARSSSHANPNAPVDWTYKTNDTIADVNTSGYFNAVAGEVKVGDRIYAYCDADGTPAPAHFFVASNTGTVVDVANGDALTVTDSD
jgi:hypothetical protein